MKTKNYNNNFGNDPKICKFYEELKKILSKKPCVKSITITSNLKKKRIAINTEKQNNFEKIKIVIYQLKVKKKLFNEKEK